MATSPQQFFRFLAENSELILVLYERGEIDEAELLALIGRCRAEGSPATDHVRRQLEDLGIVERAAHSDAAFEVSPPVVDILAWLTHRQRLSSAAVLQAYLTDIEQSERDLSASIRKGDPSAAAVALRELDSLVDRVRVLSEGNREAVVSEAQGLRAAEGVSAVDRFTLVARLWERHLTPLRHLVRVQGEMEQLLDRLRTTLDDGDQRFLAHGPVQRAFSRSLARLARMRRTAFDDHHAAIQEVEPLYRRVRRDSRWLLGASRALGRVRVEGVKPLDLDQRLGLVGWRTRYLMADDKLRARMAALVGYTPPISTPIANSPPAPKLPLITRDDLSLVAAASVPILDVLSFVLDRWPHHPLDAQLRAFGELSSGKYGPLEASGARTPRRYRAVGAELEAVPLALIAFQPNAEVSP